MTPSSKIPPPRSAQLFNQPDSPSAAPPAGVYIANVDGASRGNPGPAAYAVVIRDPQGRTVLELAKKMGRETNNVAEYYALLAALDYAISHGIKALRIRSDSELLVRQIQGRYKVKSSDLKPLYERATRLSRQLNYFTIEHVRREQNREADALANLALDSGNISNADAKLSSATSGIAEHAAPRPDGAATAKSSALQDSASRLSFRAQVVKGTLVPVDPLDLPEGALVDVNLRLRDED